MSRRQRTSQHDQAAIRGPCERCYGTFDLAASRTSTGRTSTPSDDAADWMAPKKPGPAAMAGSEDRRPCHARRDLLEQLQPFCRHAISRAAKPVALPPGRDRLSTKPAPTGSATAAKTIGTVRVASNSADTAALPLARMTSGASANQFGREFAHRGGIAATPAIVDPDVRPTVHPIAASLARTPSGGRVPLYRPLERSEHADPAHPRCLLRARRERPAPPHHPEHREIPAASCPPPGSGGSIVSAQTSALIGAETGFATAT